MANLRLQSQGLSPLLSFDGPLSTLTDPEYSSLMPEDLQQTLVKQANHALSDICPKVKLDELRNPKLLIVYKTTGSFIVSLLRSLSLSLFLLLLADGILSKTIFENDIDVLWVLFQHMTLSTATDLCERFNCWGANLDELKVLRGQDMLEWMAVTSHWNHGDLQWLSYPAVKPFPKPFLEPDPITSQKWIEAIKSVLLKYPEHVKFTIREGLDPPPSCPGKENTWLFVSRTCCLSLSRYLKRQQAAQIVIAQWHYMEAEGEWPHHYGRCGMWGKYLTAAQAEHAFSTIRGLLETP